MEHMSCLARTCEDIRDDHAMTMRCDAGTCTRESAFAECMRYVLHNASADSHLASHLSVQVGFATGANKSSEIRHNQKQKMGAHIAQAPLMAKPAGCTTVFLGNLPFTITDESLTAAFQHCGEIVQIRWVEKDGEFKGSGERATDGTIGQCGVMLMRAHAVHDMLTPRVSFCVCWYVHFLQLRFHRICQHRSDR